MVHRGERPAGRSVGLDWAEQYGRCYAQAVLRAVWVIAGVFVVRYLLQFVSNHGFAPFAWWRIFVGGAGLGALVVLG